MRTFTLTVDPDGRVAIPDTHPGQMLTIRVDAGGSARTLAAARDEEERAEVVAEIKRLAGKLREVLDLGNSQLSRTHGDLLYDEQGLPR